MCYRVIAARCVLPPMKIMMKPMHPRALVVAAVISRTACLMARVNLLNDRTFCLSNQIKTLRMISENPVPEFDFELGACVARNHRHCSDCMTIVARCMALLDFGECLACPTENSPWLRALRVARNYLI